MIDEETGKNMLAIGESVFQTNAYKMFQIGGMKDIYGIKDFKKSSISNIKQFNNTAG